MNFNELAALLLLELCVLRRWPKVLLVDYCRMRWHRWHSRSIITALYGVLRNVGSKRGRQQDGRINHNIILQQ